MTAQPTSTSHTEALANALMPVFKSALRWLGAGNSLPSGIFSVSNSPDMPDTGSYLVLCLRGSSIDDGMFIGQIAWKYSDGSFYQRSSSSIGWTAWAAVGGGGGGGGKTLITTVTAANQATVDFTTGFNDIYDRYEITFDQVIAITNGSGLWMRTGRGVGPTYDTTLYRWGGLQGINNVTGSANDAITDRIMLSATAASASGPGNAAGEWIDGEVRFSNPEVTGQKIFDTVTRYIRTDHAAMGGYRGTGESEALGTAITALQFGFQSGNISSGVFKLWGISKT